MNKIEFVSHQSFPNDEFIKELVYLCIDEKYRVAYVRKTSKAGTIYWGPVSVGLTVNGQREYFDSFISDSKFLDLDIKDFLEKRKWEVSEFKTPERMKSPYDNCQNSSEVINDLFS